MNNKDTNPPEEWIEKQDTIVDLQKAIKELYNTFCVGNTKMINQNASKIMIDHNDSNIKIDFDPKNVLEIVPKESQISKKKDEMQKYRMKAISIQIIFLKKKMTWDDIPDDDDDL